MLDADTRRRIDTARDILVGKVPDPKSQVEQITIALIYKFMDDMDAESEELGGKRKFFTGRFARYGWAKLMDRSLGGHEMLGLYGEGISKMPENPGIPPLFRGIFKNAYLPYRDPETLKAFLKIIDEFSYDHSERLGDAFEYLLSVLGSQGDAGQFRTPRHIIDFMVEVLAPRKDETILDPACGTAGFLISAYKHILRTNTDAKGHNRLTPDDKGRLAKNFKGYDISPDMVRLSLVNLYLHGFTDPHIYEYDTLTSEERWNEFADVILANPPFMSPKGGIKPHKRFSIQAKRSEVLFVDYMAEHLKPAGRAGIIVPEGIIFQSQTAYKELRKMLVENSLVAVISLPAGCFNPYAGVKTSILILDKSLAKQSNTIAFFKVENDGFGLGAQRRAIEKNDLPLVKAELAAYLRSLRTGSPAEASPKAGLIVRKEKIAANGDYNLSGERYREGDASDGLMWPLVSIGDVCIIQRGASPRPIHDFITDAPDGVNWIKIGDAEVGAKYITTTKERVTPEGAAKSRRVKPGDFILSNSMSFGRPYVMATEGCIHDGWLLLRDQSPLLDQDFLYNILGSDRVFAQFKQAATGGVVNNLNSEIVRGVKIPLPPLEVQKEIVAEIEGYQKVVNGARAVLDHYRPHIPIHPDWPMVELRDIIDELESGVSVNSVSTPTNRGEIGILKTSCVTTGIFRPEEHKAVVPDELRRVRCPVRGNTIIISRMNTEALVGANAYVDKDHPLLFLPDRLWQTVITRSDVEVRYIQTVLASDSCRRRISAICGGTSGSMKNIAKQQLLSITVPLPPLARQQAIVAEIEAEQALVAANRELIDRFEKKIQATLARIWGEETPAAPEN
jgi:type I restriction enzyme M protein